MCGLFLPLLIYTLTWFLWIDNKHMQPVNWITHSSDWTVIRAWVDFAGSSAAEESTRNAGDPGSVPGSGRSLGEGIGYSTPAFMGFPGGSAVKHLPTMRETWVWFLGWEDPLEEGMASHSSILAWRIPIDRGAWQATVHEVAQSDMIEQLSPQRTGLE